MSFDQFVQDLSWGIYVIIFVVVTMKAIRDPLRTNIDIALLFGAATAIVALSAATSTHLIEPGRLTGAITVSLLLAMIYMLLRLVDDFSNVPAWVMRGSEVLLALFVIVAFAVAPSLPRWVTTWVTTLELLYILGLLFYSVPAFVGETLRSSGVTRRRLIAVTLGSIWLCVIFVLAGVTVVIPGLASSIGPLTGLAGLASSISYYVGFATPSVLRR